MDLEDVAIICAICTIFLGLILMTVAVVAAFPSCVRRLRRNDGQDKSARKGGASARWFHWLFLCGFVLLILAVGALFIVLSSDYRATVAYGRSHNLQGVSSVERARGFLSLLSLHGLFLCSLLLLMIGISRRWGVVAAARFSAWAFPLVVAAGILVPTFAPAGDGPRPPACTSNLKQLGLAFLIYADDYDDKLPPAGSWPQVALPYTRNEQIFVCPATRKRYIFNEALAGKDIEEIENWAEVPMCWDALTDDGKPPHHGGFNVAFLDGHVAWVKLDEFRELRKDTDKDAELPDM